MTARTHVTSTLFCGDNIQSIYGGAGNRVRTDDLLITNQLLYQLSYAGNNARSVAQRAVCDKRTATNGSECLP
jgi:hypothetical protein